MRTLTAALALTLSVAAPALATATPTPADGVRTVPANTGWDLIGGHSTLLDCKAAAVHNSRGIVPQQMTQCELFTDNTWGFYTTIAGMDTWAPINTGETREECLYKHSIDITNGPDTVTKCQMLSNGEWGYYPTVKWMTIWSAIN